MPTIASEFKAKLWQEGDSEAVKEDSDDASLPTSTMKGNHGTVLLKILADELSCAPEDICEVRIVALPLV